jgi:hypothetical protein
LKNSEADEKPITSDFPQPGRYGNWTDCSAGDGEPARVFGESQTALYPTGVSTRHVTGHVRNFRIVVSLDHNFVVRAKPPKACADGIYPSLRVAWKCAADKQNHGQTSNTHSDPSAI